MNIFLTLAALALGGLLVAGCNPNRDHTDPAMDRTVAPADVPPPDTMAPVPNPGDPALPPPGTDPYAQPPAPTTPDEQPPPNN